MTVYNPRDKRPLDFDDLENEYVPKENETRPQKVARYKKVRKMLKQNVDEQVGVKDVGILSSFRRGVHNGE